MIIANSEARKVERILDFKQRYQNIHYLISWAGCRYVRTSWKLAENLRNAAQLVDGFHCIHPGEPRLCREGVNSESFLSFFTSLMGCDAVQLASAQVLLPADYSHVVVEFPGVPYVQDNHGICFLCVSLNFPFMQRCSSGDLRLERG